MPFNVTSCDSAVARVSALASYDVLSLRLQARQCECAMPSCQEEEENQAEGLEKLSILQR